MAAINNVATSNGYTPAATLQCSPSRSLTVQVNNAAIYYQLLLSYPGTVQGGGVRGPRTAYYNRPGDILTGSNAIATEERFLQPGFWTFGEGDFGDAYCVGIQFRSAAANTPAQVTASN